MLCSTVHLFLVFFENNEVVLPQICPGPRKFSRQSWIHLRFDELKILMLSRTIILSSIARGKRSGLDKSKKVIWTQ